MWILPSRGRPHNLKRLLSAYIATKASTPVWLRLDDDDTNPGLSHPCWTTEIGPRLPLSAIYNEAFRQFPDLAWYGFIADDVVPETPEWDLRLIDAAGTDGMAVPAGGHDPDGAPHFVLGGDLVRSVGWLSLPELSRLYIDTAWMDIAEFRGKMVRVDEVVLTHHHFSNRKALYDKTYRKPSKAEDRAIYEDWRGNHGYSP